MGWSGIGIIVDEVGVTREGSGVGDGRGVDEDGEGKEGVL